MTERANRQAIDELLAANTDRLLNGERPSQAEIEAMPAEARSLWKTIEQLAYTGAPAAREADVRNHIRVKLNARWNEIGPAVKQGSIGKRFLSNKSIWMPAMGVIALAAILLIGLLITPTVMPAQTATANFQPVVFIGGLVVLAIIAFVVWRLKHK